MLNLTFDILTEFATAISGGNMTKYKYNEDKTIAKAVRHIENTYKQHYVSQNNVQLMDVFFSDPQEGMVFCKTNAMKYLSRFGKKDGYNESDLLKAIHYVVLMAYCNNLIEGNTNGNDSSRVK